jgi:hypothetical protein
VPRKTDRADYPSFVAHRLGIGERPTSSEISSSLICVGRGLAAGGKHPLQSVDEDLGEFYSTGIIIGLPSVAKRLSCGADVPVDIIRNAVLNEPPLTTCGK